MRLLFAKTLQDERSAIVIESSDGRLIGGVVWMTDFRMDVGFNDGGTNDTMQMKFVWQWWRLVDSPEDFAQRREWESIASPRPAIEHKS